jgi:hypothetical protein
LYKGDLASDKSLNLKPKMHSDNLKTHSKNLKVNHLQGSNAEVQGNLGNKAETLDFKSDQLNVDDSNLKDKISKNKKVMTVKFKEANPNEAEPILNVKDDDNFSNAEKIKDILNRAKILNTNSDKNYDLRGSPVKTNLNTTPPRTPEREQVYNMIELGNHADSIINNKNNIYESPNMIKDSLKVNSNSKNQPNAIEFIQEKNISNTTFRAASEVNKNK